MQDKNKTQPKAFRITEETAEKFKEIAQSLGANQQQALAKLIEVYEMESGKESLPEMRTNIDTFEINLLTLILRRRCCASCLTTRLSSKTL